MRKILVLASFAVIPFLATVSRAESTENPRFGVVGGLDFANASVSDSSGATTPSTTSRTGFLAGVAGEFPLAESFYLQPELQYTQQGTQEATSSTVTSIIKYDTLRLPIFAKFQAPVGPGFKFFAMVGPSFGLAVNKKLSLSQGNLSTEADISPIVNSFNVAIDGGVGVELELTPDIGLALGARYSLGLTNISKAGSVTAGSTTITSASTLSTKTRDFQVAANLFFNM